MTVSSDKISHEPVNHPAGNGPRRRNVTLRFCQQARHYPRIQNRALATISHASLISGADIRDDRWGQITT